jgi:hypothetical protein
MKTPSKKATPKPLPVKRQLATLRRNVWLLRKHLDGEAAGLELQNECSVTGSKTPEERHIEAGALRRCTYELDLVLQAVA